MPDGSKTKQSFSRRWRGGGVLEVKPSTNDGFSFVDLVASGIASFPIMT